MRLVALFRSVCVGSTPELGEELGGYDRPTSDPLLLDVDASVMGCLPRRWQTTEVQVLER